MFFSDHYEKKIFQINVSLFLKVLLIIFLSLVFIATLLSLEIKDLLNFDSQELTTWEYSANRGLLPYKDVFYPYGIFSYYYKSIAILKMIYMFESIALIFGFYLVLRKIIKNKNYLLSSLIFLSAVVLLIGNESFVRYGIFYFLALYFGQILIKKNASKSAFFISGLLSGLTFSFFFDLGAYLIVVTSVFIFVKEFLFRKYFSLNSFIISILFFTGGIIIGLIPIVIYLSNNMIWTDFIDSLLKIKDYSAYAKTPYLHSLRSWPALINLLVFIAAVWLLIYEQAIKKTKIDSITVGIFSLSLVFFVLLQKSIIRSIDLSIFFVSSLILILIFYKLVIYRNRVFIPFLILMS